MKIHAKSWPIYSMETTGRSWSLILISVRAPRKVTKPPLQGVVWKKGGMLLATPKGV